jgi:DNA-binding PadR family transcriptional regulator
LYPALHRLERAGLIAGTWSSGGGRRRRSYELTAAGHVALAEKRSAWRELVTTLSALLNAGALRE